jgi:hypothetical protein
LETEEQSVVTDDELITAFEAGQVPDGGFHHEQHVRLAWIYLGREPLLPALTRFIAGLKQFAEAQGQPGLYHQTITVAFFLLIEDRLARGGRGSEWLEFAAANADLLVRRPSLLTRYYSPELLMSATARARFVWPDRTGTLP